MSVLMGKIQKYLATSPDLKPTVVGYILRDEEVLLGLRKTSSTNLGLNLMVGIGGGREEGETDEEAFNREVLEEVGLKVLSSQDMGQVVFLFPNKPKWTQKVKIFLSEKGDWKGYPVETESIRPVWVKKTKLPLNQMWPDNAIWLSEVLKGNKINAIFLLEPDGEVIEYKLEIIDP